jgi:hypothetical protein
LGERREKPQRRRGNTCCDRDSAKEGAERVVCYVAAEAATHKERKKQILHAAQTAATNAMTTLLAHNFSSHFIPTFVTLIEYFEVGFTSSVRAAFSPWALFVF